MPPFKVHADFQLSGDQPSAAEGLAEGVLAGEDYLTLQELKKEDKLTARITEWLPFNAPLEHALNIDFVNEAEGPGARVAVELTLESARNLVETIHAVLARAQAGGYVEESTKAEG